MYVGLGNKLRVIEDELDCSVGSKAFSSSPFGHMLAFGERPRSLSQVGNFGWTTVRNGVQDSSDSTQRAIVHSLRTAGRVRPLRQDTTMRQGIFLWNNATIYLHRTAHNPGGERPKLSGNGEVKEAIHLPWRLPRRWQQPCSCPRPKMRRAHWRSQIGLYLSGSRVGSRRRSPQQSLLGWESEPRRGRVGRPSTRNLWAWP